MKKKSFLLLSHCLLNQLTRAGGSYTEGATKKLLSLLSQYDIPVYQLPCPEYIFMGPREKRTQDAWERVKGFKNFCSELAEKVKEEIWDIVHDKNLIMVAISRSPCCSASKVYRGDRIIEGKGLWVEELEKRFKLNIIEFDFKKVEESLKNINEFLKKRTF